MTEENEFEWDQNTLGVNESGEVVGQAYRVREDGYSVDVSVTSYEYNDGEDMNHVPYILVADEHGNIESEPHAHDDSNPDVAIDRALNVGRNVYENLDDYLD